jgi:hypothetical protein
MRFLALVHVDRKRRREKRGILDLKIKFFKERRTIYVCSRFHI